MANDILETFDLLAWQCGDAEYHRAHDTEYCAYLEAKAAEEKQRRFSALREIAKSYEDAAKVADAFAAFIRTWDGKVINKRFYDALEKANIGVRVGENYFTGSVCFETQGTWTAAGEDHPNILYIGGNNVKKCWCGEKMNRMNAAAWIDIIQEYKEKNLKTAAKMYDEADHIEARIEKYNAAVKALNEAGKGISGFARDIFRDEFEYASTLK